MLEVAAIYSDSGSFQHIPTRPGFTMEIRCEGKVIAATDGSWEACHDPSWLQDTGKISIQHGPYEWVDARLSERCRWQACQVLAPAHAVPWGALTFDHVRPPRFRWLEVRPQIVVTRLQADCSLNWLVPVTKLCHQGVASANTHISRACALATIIVSDENREIQLSDCDWNIAANGSECSEVLHLRAGANPALFFVRDIFLNSQEALLRFPKQTGLEFRSVEGHAESEWTFVRLPEFDFFGNDLSWPDHPHLQRDRFVADYHRYRHESIGACSSEVSLAGWIGTRGRPILLSLLAREDPHDQFLRRSPVEESSRRLALPVSLSVEQGLACEAAMDLGELSAGYFCLDIDAPEGAVLDFSAVEHVSKEEVIQHTGYNRNGFRYVCRSGRQEFTSLTKRFGRHLFVTLREAVGPVTIHGVRLLESLAGVDRIARFRCSDSQLDAVWENSMRTMELCMDDVFVDSLYEQTLWTGDAMVQQLYGLWGFDSRDLAVRAIRLGAQSLDRLPMVGAQVPSSWECLLPAWSFLWGVSVWDYYFYSGDKSMLTETWASVRKNLLAAECFLNASGLFEAPFWNLLEWAPIESAHRIVTHNSQLMLAAVTAGSKIATALDKMDDARWLMGLRLRLSEGLSALCSSKNGYFPDAVTSEGLCVGCSIHPQFLALNFNLVSEEHAQQLGEFLAHPPSVTTDIASPFMTHFLYGAWENLGQPARILAGIRKHFAPMLDSGDGTLWETLPGATGTPDGWPTRSRCHGWSASPIYYLPRTVLGIRPVGEGSRRFELRPHLGDLTWAEGSIATPFGPVSVRVEKTADGCSITEIQAPDEVTVVWEKSLALRQSTEM